LGMLSFTSPIIFAGSLSSYSEIMSAILLFGLYLFLIYIFNPCLRHNILWSLSLFWIFIILLNFLF